MAGKDCIKRLQKEYKALLKEPVSHIVAHPSPNNILEWHYVLEGSEGTPFAGGYYHGKITFPSNYPYKPPSIRMITPNGRFSTNTKICLSMSDYHPETWNPLWSVASILTGLLSFMMDNSPTSGSIITTNEQKKELARLSLEYNCKSPIFRKIFPEYVEKFNLQQTAKQAEEQSHQEAENSTATKISGAANESTNTERNEMRVANGNETKKMPFWFFVLIISILGALISLPLYQL